MKQTYTVKSGDTLSRIAQQHHVSVNALAQANGIHDKNHIAVGRQLAIPGSDRPTKNTDSSAAETGGWAETLLRFVDSIERPIVGLTVRLVTAGQEIKVKTDGGGFLPRIASSKLGEPIQIHVQRHLARGGGEKPIGNYTPIAGTQTVKVQSGLHVETSRLRTHIGQPAVPPKVMRGPPGTKHETQTEQGNPLTCSVGDECPNQDSLKLGPNNEYREWVRKAAQRAGLVPQAVAAVMNAEAAKDKNNKWKVDSKSKKSSATGMTQFLDATWVSEALRAGTYLNDKASREGWLSSDAKGHLQFKKADGSYITQPNLQGKLIALIKPARTAADSNLQKLLDLREQAEYAITAAMDYAKANLDGLRQRGYAVDDLNDTEKARIMYLCHHLGIGDAIRFIQNTIPEEDVHIEKKGKKQLTQNGAKKLLSAQVGSTIAENKYKKENDDSWVKGHRAWLDAFIGNHIVTSIFACPGNAHEDFKEDEKTNLVNITNSLKK
ncbi:MAG: LysM peptidoglycan-binding domain-containing protein [Nevskia sp.]|jgi:murein DD-endopeptidase MepM/ murein hydrolase activator NlpD|nr:LysM peptidoglycan-binding domain-containing protein [Nevskia sp.]